MAPILRQRVNQKAFAHIWSWCEGTIVQEPGESKPVHLRRIASRPQRSALAFHVAEAATHWNGAQARCALIRALTRVTLSEDPAKIGVVVFTE